MTRAELLRVAIGIAIGLGLASLPFLQYGGRGHHHQALAAPAPPPHH